VEKDNDTTTPRFGELHFSLMSAPVTNPIVKLGVGPPRELVGHTSFLLKRLGWAIKERASEAYEAVGASPYHYSVLALLDEGTCSAQATIADALGYDRSWFVGLLDELEEAGLVERKRDPVDRRRHLVSLLPAGKKRLAQLREISRRVEDEFFAPLDTKERERLHALLLELAAHHDPRYAPADADR
jgi:DNA-binding MarR family transcriptional regulator